MKLEMRKVLLSMLCMMALGVSAQKIDFDFQGKTGDERHTEAGFLNWPVGSKAVEADTIPRLKADGSVDYPKPALGALPEGMQIICCNPGGDPGEGLYNGIVSVWAKNNVESNTLSRMAGDAVCPTLFDDSHDRFDPGSFATLRFIIKGMKAGTHTLQAWHNCTDKGHGQPPMVKAMVNGMDACAPVQQSIWADVIQSIDDIPSTFITFTAVDGQDVVIDYVAVPAEGVEYANHRPYVCGMVFDAADPNMKVSNMRPLNNDIHVDAVNGAVTLSWTGAASAASHRVMIGTSEDNLQEVRNSSAETYTATGLSNLNTYYWRVDEVPASGDAVEGELFSFRINHLAFPGAEGYGRFANGGRGGQVVHVTSLEDDGSEGTLRYALEIVKGPRTVVFDVSGIITLTKKIVVNEPYVTIAGQTAPGDGIMVRGYQISLHSEGITRFVRLRLGSVINEDKGTGYSCVDLQGKQHSIVDHTSVEWGTAETFKAAGNYTANITVQNTIVAEALTNGSAGEDGFGYGFDSGGEYGSFHHNLMASNYMNSPRISGGQDATLKWLGEEEFYNNVAYNWMNSAANGAAAKVNFAGNYYKAGPATPAEATKIMTINVPKNGTGTIDYYVNGNVFDKNGTLMTDDIYGISLLKDDEGNPVEDGYQPNISETKVVDNGAVYETAPTAYARVLSEVGASLKRDATDKRIINEVLNGTTSLGENGMIDHIEDSDYDVYENVTRPADFDANANGIADWYEKATGKNDANADSDGDGYTNLEDYLNYMAMPNATVGAGQTAVFDLSAYFAGISDATFTVNGIGTVANGKLSVTPSATDQGFLTATVTATKGEVSITRQFNVYVDGTASGIHTALTKARVAYYELYNAAGVLVQQGEAGGTSVDKLNLKGKAGVYILKIKDTEGRSRSFSVLKK
jgi:hypothetical protein